MYPAFSRLELDDDTELLGELLVSVPDGDLGHSGDVGDVLISDKLLNGFKVRFDGSAKSATVKLIIKGGM